MIKNILKYFLLFLILFGVLGCSNSQIVPLVRHDLNPNLATIVIKRPSAMIAAFNSVPIYDDGKLIGNIANGGEIIWQRQEGTFNLSISHDAFQDSEINIYIKLSKGKIYTFNYKFNSLFGPSTLKFVDDGSTLNPIIN